MTDPFHIEGPTLLSFSGGRTSGRMLRLFLDAYPRGLPADAHVLFANTGKERDETLDFVQAVSDEWGIEIVWLERPDGGGFRRVTYETASRKGEPFAQLIEERNYLPNPVARFCTADLKIRPMRDWMRASGYEHWTNIVGIRADEPRRLAKRAGKISKERWVDSFPLARAGITVKDVRAFWKGQTFDLQLQPWEGNCDLCFLKGIHKRQRVMRDRPDLAPWWIGEESLPPGEGHTTSPTFRSDTPSYARLFRIVQQQPLLIDSEAPGADLTDLGDCECDMEAA